LVKSSISKSLGVSTVFPKDSGLSISSYLKTPTKFMQPLITRFSLAVCVMSVSVTHRRNLASRASGAPRRDPRGTDTNAIATIAVTTHTIAHGDLHGLRRAGVDPPIIPQKMGRRAGRLGMIGEEKEVGIEIGTGRSRDIGAIRRRAGPTGASPGPVTTTADEAKLELKKVP
jgi:hypothetical protein